MRAISGYIGRHHVALLALFVALGGTSMAATNALLPKNSVGTAQLKNGAVTKKKINKKAIRALKGNRGLQGEQGAQGAPGPPGPPGAAATRLWAVINGAGSTVRSSGVSSSTRTDQGVFSVVFNTDVTNCSYLSQQGFATAEIVFATGFVTAQPKVGNPNALTVLTTNASGSPADRPFDVAVFC